MSSHSLLSVWITSKSDIKPAAISDTLGGILSKFKSEIDFVIISQDKTAFEASLSSNKNTKDSFAAGKIKILDSKQQAAENTNADYILPFEFSADVNINLLIQWFLALKNRTNAVYVASTDHAESSYKKILLINYLLFLPDFLLQLPFQILLEYIFILQNFTNKTSQQTLQLSYCTKLH
jgi:hypothetical protein